MKPLMILCLITLLPFSGFSQSKNDNTTQINITIKDHEIFNNNTSIGSFKNLVIDTDLTSVVIYNKAKARVAEATYAKGEENWTILTPVDQEKMYLRWNKEHTLESLFQFLVEKKYL